MNRLLLLIVILVCFSCSTEVKLESENQVSNVRKDVKKWIELQAVDSNVKNALSQYAKILNKSLHYSTDSKGAISNGLTAWKALGCINLIYIEKMSHLLPKIRDYNKRREVLLKKSHQNRKRALARFRVGTNEFKQSRVVSSAPIAELDKRFATTKKQYRMIGKERDFILGEILIKTFNTLKRQSAYKKYERLLTGQSYVVAQDMNSVCEFVIK